MKNLFFLAAVLSLALPTISCKSKKETASAASSSSNAASENSAKQESKYALVVSFISKGAGTDGTKVTPFLEYVISHPKKPDYITIRWGREGETDYCFKLNEFKTDKEKSAFIDEVKKISGGSDMMVVSENAVSIHKGR